MWDVASWLFGIAHGQNMARMQAPEPPRRVEVVERPDPVPRRREYGAPLDPEVTYNLMVRSRARQGIILPRWPE